MKHIIPLALGASLAATAPGFAQSSAEGLYYSGFVQGEYYDSDSFSESALYGDVTLGFNSTRGGSLAWGAELSGEFLHAEGETLDIWNPILFFDSGYGRFSVGAPKSVVDSYGLGPAFHNAGYLAISEFGILAGGLPRYVALVTDDMVPGVRYDGTFGQTRVGVSFHRYSEGSADLDMWAVAARHSFSGVDVFASFERGSGDGDSANQYAIGLEGTYGSFGYGAEYGNGAVLEEDIDTIRGYVDYGITPQIVVGAEAMRVSVPGDDVTIYGVNADYTFWRNAYVGLSYFDTDQSGSDPLYSARLGWKLDY